MPELLKDFKIAPGTTCEVYTPGNDQIFLGKVSAYDGENLTIVDRSGREVPSAIFKSVIKLKLYLSDSDAAFLQGQITGSNDEMWRLNELVLLTAEENRGEFRQRVSCRTLIHCISGRAVGTDQEVVYGRLANISSGGVLVGTKVRIYKAGDLLQLGEVEIIPEERPFQFLCEVRWAEIDVKETLYCCRFVDLSAREQDRLYRAIFALQRKAMQQQRNLRR